MSIWDAFMSESWRGACVATFVISALPAVLLLVVPQSWLKHRHGEVNVLNVFLCFAAGGLLGDVFLHALPHLLMPAGHDHGPMHGHENAAPHSHTRELVVGLCVLLGFFTFFTADRVAALRMQKRVQAMKAQATAAVNAAAVDNNGASESATGCGGGVRRRVASAAAAAAVTKFPMSFSAAPTPTAAVAEGGSFSCMRLSGWLNIVADAMHNFTDGIAIGVAFHSGNQGLALATTVGVLVHEVPHELGDFAILVNAGLSKRNAVLAQLGTALAAFAGTALGYAASAVQYQRYQEGLLALTCGGFVYLATCVVLPTVLDREGGGGHSHGHDDVDRSKGRGKGATSSLSLIQILLDGAGFLVGVALMAAVALTEH